MTAHGEPDPAHTYTPAPSLDDLRHDVQTVYGRLLHAEHDAEASHDAAGEAAYHHAAALLAQVMWKEAS